MKVFRGKNKIWKESDIYLRQLKELFEISFPKFYSSGKYEKELAEFIAKKSGSNMQTRGSWVYFPWNGQFVHMVNEQDYLMLRTNRNRNIITDAEQQMLHNACIGIAGLSVGSSLAFGLAHQGIARHLKLAEFDSLETTNLNRIRAAVYQIGVKKIDIAAQQIYEIDPYSRLHLLPERLSQKNLLTFVNGRPKPDIIFEIIDDFAMKINLRLAAREAGIPVVSPANLGDSILIDIERFDLDRSLPLFNGKLGKLPEEILQKPDEDKNKYAVEVVGIENIPERVMQSVREINKTLKGRPQLSSTVAISGAIAAYISRKIILGEELPGGRRRLSLDQVFQNEQSSG